MELSTLLKNLSFQSFSWKALLAFFPLYILMKKMATNFRNSKKFKRFSNFFNVQLDANIDRKYLSITLKITICIQQLISHSRQSVTNNLHNYKTTLNFHPTLDKKNACKVNDCNLTFSHKSDRKIANFN